MIPKTLSRSPETVYLAMGSNKGQRRRYLTQALNMVDTLPLTSLKRLSSVYRTAPVGGSTQFFLNMVAQLESTRAPPALMKSLLEIERSVGRRRTGRANEDRVIDLDLLLYGDRVSETPTLILPHPRMHKRQFVLKPLCDLSPQLVHPVFGKTMETLLKESEKTGVWEVAPLELED